MDQGIESQLDFPVGLGLRFSFARELIENDEAVKTIDFLEIAPENYIGTGGFRHRILSQARNVYPLLTHGLMGDLIGLAPFDEGYFSQLKEFIHEWNIPWFSDHLCVTRTPSNVLHELLPMRFDGESLKRCVERIQRVQDILGVPVAVENVSAYMRVEGSIMDEAHFISELIAQSGCQLLLDINNVYVNAKNFGHRAHDTIDALPLRNVIQVHLAGHEVEDDGLRLDTHGTPIHQNVFELFQYALPRLVHGTPILLERDKAIPPLSELLLEIDTIRASVSAFMRDSLPTKNSS